MYYNITQEQLRSHCKNCIESFEKWSRRLIDQELTKIYGDNYFFEKVNDTEYIIKAEIRSRAENMLLKHPNRFNKIIDTLFIEDIIYILCKPSLYKICFKKVLDYMYPQGVDEAREFLTRIVPIRNALSHSNLISVRETEKAICYSNDFIEGVKMFYTDTGKEKDWNVPTIIQIIDSNGNVLYDNVKGVINQDLCFYVGDSYSVSVEVDSSYEKNDYKIRWIVGDDTELNEYHNSNQCNILFSNKDVGENWSIICEIISTKDWHKKRHCDDWVRIRAIVLPFD